MNPDQVGHTEFIVADESSDSAKVRHDIRASLAITRGFSQALESSFSELCQTVEHALSATDNGTEREAVAKIAELEADCGFCLSRIERSLEQLSVRIDASLPVVSGHENSSGSTS